jgi:NDP-mannose synthase
MINKTAIVLAGGKGVRLKPYTLAFPKPMLPVGEMPILEIILRQLKFHGFDKVVLSLGYMNEIIISYFETKNNADYLPKIEYYVEDSPLGTSGPIKAINPTDDSFLVMNGDILTNLDFTQMFQYHLDSKSDFTVAVRPTKHVLKYGIVEFDKSNNVKEFKEKPVLNFFDNVGIYIYNRENLKFIKPKVEYGVNTLVKSLLKDKNNVKSYYTEDEYYWIDIGSHGDYEKANKDFKNIKKKFPFLSNK